MSQGQGGGQPTKYRDEYIQQMLDFFSIEPLRHKVITITDKNGNVTTKEGELTYNRLPTFERFAAKELEVCTDTLVEWASVKTKSGKLKHKKFSAAYKRCKQFQKNFLMELGSYGLFNAPFTKFVAMNITDMRDKREVDHTSDGERIGSINYIVPKGVKE